MCRPVHILTCCVHVQTTNLNIKINVPFLIILVLKYLVPEMINYLRLTCEINEMTNLQWLISPEHYYTFTAVPPKREDAHHFQVLLFLWGRCS